MCVLRPRWRGSICPLNLWASCCKQEERGSGVKAAPLLSQQDGADVAARSAPIWCGLAVRPGLAFMQVNSPTWLLVGFLS
jgi:hypothetical protein